MMVATQRLDQPSGLLTAANLMRRSRGLQPDSLSSRDWGAVPPNSRRLTGAGTWNNLERHARVAFFFSMCSVLHITNPNGIVALIMVSAIPINSAEVCNGQRGSGSSS